MRLLMVFIWLLGALWIAGCGDDGDNLCGNGAIDPGETCDPPDSCPTSCDDEDVCTSDSLTGSAGACTATCRNEPIISCLDDDGCCPVGCDDMTDNDCPCLPTVEAVDTTGNAGYDLSLAIDSWDNPHIS